jgi:hypothetical protein
MNIMHEIIETVANKLILKLGRSAEEIRQMVYPHMVLLQMMKLRLSSRTDHQ